MANAFNWRYHRRDIKEFTRSGVVRHPKQGEWYISNFQTRGYAEQNVHVRINIEREIAIWKYGEIMPYPLDAYSAGYFDALEGRELYLSHNPHSSEFPTEEEEDSYRTGRQDGAGDLALEKREAERELGLLDN